MVSKDVVVIGGGPGGYVAAIRAAQLGASVGLVEKDTLGGTCVNRGCIPTKALLRGVELLHLVRSAPDYGINVGEASLDFARLMARKREVVDRLVSGVGVLMRSNAIEVFQGKGRLVSATRIEVESATGQGQEIEAGKVILAPGSSPAPLPLRGAEGGGVITSDAALEFAELPHSLVVIGGGVVGVELAAIFAGLGVAVTVVEIMPRLIPNEDDEFGLMLEEVLKREGIEVLTGARVEGIEDEGGGGKAVLVSAGADKKRLVGQWVLVAVGRKANLDGIGLEEVGVKVESGYIAVDGGMHTSVPGIYAVGDAVGGFLLAHVASAEGRVAAENALGQGSAMDYRAVPRCIYTLPELAAVGLGEEEAKEQGYRVRVSRFPFSANARATVLGQGEGVVKFVCDATSAEVLGVHIIGPGATELIAEAALAMKMEGTAQEIFSTLHPHPTLSEAVMEAALGAEGAALHIPPRRGS